MGDGNKFVRFGIQVHGREPLEAHYHWDYPGRSDSGGDDFMLFLAHDPHDRHDAGNPMQLVYQGKGPREVLEHLKGEMERFGVRLDVEGTLIKTRFRMREPGSRSTGYGELLSSSYDLNTDLGLNPGY
jgi:hypothetical protein